MHSLIAASMPNAPYVLLGKAEFQAMAAHIHQNLWTLSGLPEEEFNKVYLIGVLERLRGQQAATTKEKSRFIAGVLDFMTAQGKIEEWKYVGSTGRSDYMAVLRSGRIAAIEAKGSMDGNSVNIMERPAYADELVVWSVTTNPMSDVKHGIWSGIHTRLSPEYIALGKRVDMLMAWDELGSALTLRPELGELPIVEIGGIQLSPPALYLLPNQTPIVGYRDVVTAPGLDKVEFGRALSECFAIPERMVGKVQFEVAQKGDIIARRTTITLNGDIQKVSTMTPIKRDLTAYRAMLEAARQIQD